MPKGSMPPMSVENVNAATDYNGATMGVPLACDFSADSASEIFMSVLLVGGTEFIPVSPADYVVTDLGAGLFTVTPALTYASGITVRVFRWLDYTQPVDFEENGPLPADRVSAMGDRLCRLIQQVRLELGLDVAAVTLPPGSTFVQATAVFADNTARGNATPAFLGQLGVQANTGNLYRGTTIAAGGWTLIPTGSSTADVAHGGTGLSVLTTYALLAGGATGTGNIQQVSSAGAVAGYVLTFVSASALPTWQAAGNVTAAANFGTDSLMLFADGTGKGVKAAMGINAATAAKIDLGSITDTVVRPLTISQTWNNVALTGRGVEISITDTLSTITSAPLRILVGGIVMLSCNKDGTLTTVNNAVAATGYVGATGRTIFRFPADGRLTITNAAENSGGQVDVATVNIFKFRKLDNSGDAAIQAGQITASLPVVLPAYTVATVPSAATYTRGLIYVSDGTSNKRLAISDGTNWRFPDGAIVS